MKSLLFVNIVAFGLRQSLVMIRNRVFNLFVVKLSKYYSERHITSVSENDKCFEKVRLDEDRRGGKSFVKDIEFSLMFIFPDERDIVLEHSD